MDLPGMIKVWRRRFLLTAAGFTILLSSFAILVRYEQSARATSASLAKLGEKLAQMRIATVEMKQTLADFQVLLPAGYGSKTASVMLYERVDDLKMLFPKAVITISVPSEQTGSTSLPFSVKTVDANYSDFLTGLAFAQARTFPFVLINTVTIGCEQASKGGMEYTLVGTITIPNKTPNGGRR